MQRQVEFYSDQQDIPSSQKNLKLMEKTAQNQVQEKSSTEYQHKMINVKYQLKIESNQAQNQQQVNLRVSRVSNYIMPNMIREVKKCLSEAFSGPENRTTIRLLHKMFQNFQIKFQVWAFDAIILCLIFIRDRTTLLDQKKYTAKIEAISSTLQKYKQKALSNQFLDKSQRQLIETQYDLCLAHLKYYDREDLTFGQICKSKDDFREEFFSRMLTTRKKLRFKFLRIIENIEICLQEKNFLTK